METDFQSATKGNVLTIAFATIILNAFSEVLAMLNVRDPVYFIFDPVTASAMANFVPYGSILDPKKGIIDTATAPGGICPSTTPVYKSEVQHVEGEVTVPKSGVVTVTPVIANISLVFASVKTTWYPPT
jgi:hypothetical protein